MERAFGYRTHIVVPRDVARDLLFPVVAHLQIHQRRRRAEGSRAAA